MKNLNSTARLASMVAAAGMMASAAFAQQLDGHNHMVQGSARPAVAPKANQPGQPPVPAMAAPAGAAMTKPAPTFSDPEFAAVAQKLSGCWKASIPGSGDMVMGVAPVIMNGLTDTFYTEISGTESLNRPYRQSIWQLHKVGGKVRIKTLEFRASKGMADQLTGLWMAPEAFPASLGQDDLVATMDIELTKAGNGYTGKTLQKYPTNSSGAVEMSSDLKFDGTQLITSDRGYDAEGKMVWGPKEGDGYTFSHVDPMAKVTRSEGGIVVIDYPMNGGAKPGPANQADLAANTNPAKPGERISVQYMGYLENGKMFDSSYERGTPFTYTKGDRLIEGWNRAMADARKGTTRRVVIPAAMAQGDGTYHGKIPANSTVIYDVKVVEVSPAAPGMSATPGMQPPKPTITTNAEGVHPTMEPVDPNDPVVQKMQAEMKARMEARRKAMEEKAKAGNPPAGPDQPKPAEPAPK